MGTTLRDFIAQREGEIKDQQKALKLELRDLQIAKAALDAQASAHSATPPAAPVMTIKDMAREVLAGQPNGLTSSGILDGIKKMFGRDVERTSLSPQLSRLKEDGELFLQGEVWLTKAHHDEYLQRTFREASDAMAEHAAAMPEDRPDPRNTPAWDDDLEDVPF